LAHSIEGDGGGGLFRWSPASRQADDGGMAVAPAGRTGPGRWLRQTDHTELRAAWWGVSPIRDDNLDQLQAAAEFCEGLLKQTLPRLLLPHGVLKIRDTWAYSANSRIEGSSHAVSTTLLLTRAPSSHNAIMVPLHWVNNRATSYTGTVIENLTVQGQAEPGDGSDYDAIVWMSWNSLLRHVTIRKVNGYSVRATARTKDGTLSRLNFVRHKVEWVMTAHGKGMVWGEPGMAKYTDGFMEGCIFDAGTGSPDGYVLELHASGGWRVNDCVFNHPRGGALRARGELFNCTNTRFDGLWDRSGGDSKLKRGIVLSGQGKSRKGRGVFFSSNYIEVSPNAPKDFVALDVDASGIEPNSGVAAVCDNKFTAIRVASPGVMVHATSPENMSLVFSGNSFQGEDHIVFYSNFAPDRTAQHNNVHFKRNGGLAAGGGIRTAAPDPGTCFVGMQTIADGKRWDPAGRGSGPYPAWFDGSAWLKMVP
jgi:hypothetical protein